ncbi:MAG: class I SAM-dependent methyltransferase [Endomicrobiaceae bacterium]|jgi:tRNA (cmo5U34)-methyltransferase|nr:class I SAM-dependent methyltransferase [Endomicrobiaceae bacterium]
MKNRFKEIKKHFEKEAKFFDSFFYKIVPQYRQMLEILVQSMPFEKNKKLKVIDLGCGTGNLGLKAKEYYPHAHLTCVDMSENMIKMAKTKFEKYPDTVFWHGDIRKFDYSKKYDAVISSMVLHHVEGAEKIKFYKKLHKALKTGGIFLNIDIFITKDAVLQKFYTDKWISFMSENGLALNKVKEMLLRHKKEDRPVVIDWELSALKKAGFKSSDIIFKNFNFAGYTAKK